MKKVKRFIRQWRESWADAAYDDVRDEIRRLQVVQLQQRLLTERLQAEIAKLKERAKA